MRKEIKDLERALTLKSHRGSIVMEKVRCGKPGCTKCPHGPYAYLHYYDPRSGKVKRKYLGKNVSEYYKMAREEILQRIEDLSREKVEILGQVKEIDGKVRCVDCAIEEPRFCECSRGSEVDE